MRYVWALLGAVATILMPAAAQAEKRVALVIGNAQYLNTAPLNNPSNDATDVSGVLQRLGFEVVKGIDLDKRSMERLIRQFGTKLGGADVALFFYAGHGLQVGGQNYLVPTDARLASEGDVDFESLPLNLVLKQMEREAKTSIVMLDACRDNPLARNLARSMGTRSTAIGQGLAEVRTGVGTLIAFSTQPGYVALDGAGRNSPYTEALLKHAEVPGKDISAVLVEVRNDVLKATDGKQVPWEHTSLTGQVFLRALIVPPPAEGSVPPTRSYDKEIEIAFWNSVKDSKVPAVVEAYLERYPNGTFAGLARVMVDQLKAAPKPQEPVKPEVKPAEPAKVAALPKPETKPEIASPNPQVLTRSLQTELKRVGCDPGDVDGVWGSQAKEALGNFARHAKLALPTEEPTSAALDAVTSRKQRVCPLECDRGEKEVDGRCVAARPAEKPRAARRSTEETREARPRREAPEGGGGGKKLCWSQDGKSFSVVPCK
jgi:hypothetical protein